MNKWWWLTWNQAALSVEERQASVRLLLTGLCIFIALFGALLRWDPNGDLGSVSVLIAAVIGCGLARPIGVWAWPDVVRIGDEKAAARLAERLKSARRGRGD